MKEKEKKFLFKGDYKTALDFIKKDYETKIEIEQYYLMLDGSKQLRIRIIDNSSAIMCFKDDLKETDTRLEIENSIDLETARLAIETSTVCSLNKTRYTTEYKKYKLEFDVYKDRKLVVIEIEYTGEFDYTSLPIYIGDEITGKKEYSNIALAKKEN